MIPAEEQGGSPAPDDETPDHTLTEGERLCFMYNKQVCVRVQKLCENCSYLYYWCRNNVFSHFIEGSPWLALNSNTIGTVRSPKTLSCDNMV